MATRMILAAADKVGARQAVSGFAGYKTFQAWGAVSTGTGSVSVRVEGTQNGGESWDALGTITVPLTTAIASDGFTSLDAYKELRGNVTAISGTGAIVSLAY